MNQSILVVDDEPSILKSLNVQFGLEGYIVFTASSAEEALRVLEKNNIPVIVSDQRMPGMSGSEFFSKVKKQYPDTIRMIMSGYSDFEAVTEAINEGAVYKFLTKPCNDEELNNHVKSAFELIKKLKEEAYNGKIIDHALESIIVTDSNHLVESINTTYILSTEFSKEDLIGKKFQQLELCRSNEYTTDEIYTILELESVWQGELEVTKKSGKMFTVIASISSVKDENNRTQKYIYRFFEINDCNENLQNNVFDGTFVTFDSLITKIASVIFISKEQSFPIAIAYLKIFKFEQMSTQFGYHLSYKIQEMINEQFNAWENENSLIARVSDSEYAILIYDKKNEIDFNSCIKELVDIFEKPFIVDNINFNLTCYVGISVYPSDGETAEVLIQNAKIAVNNAVKENNKKISFFNIPQSYKIKKELYLENAFKQKLPLDNIKIYYQPVMELSTDRTTQNIIGLEIIPKVEKSEFGELNATEIFAMCNKTENMLDVFEYIITEAIHELNNAKIPISERFTINVNTDPYIFQDSSIVQFLNKVIQDNKFQSNAIQIGIIDSLLNHEDITLDENIREIKKMGVELLLNNFGSSEAGLSYLLKYPISILKLDKYFASNMLENKRAQTLMVDLLNMCNRLEIKCIVKGIDTVEQLTFIKNFPCDGIQGKWISDPINIDFIKLFLKSSSMIKLNENPG